MIEQEIEELRKYLLPRAAYYYPKSPDNASNLCNDAILKVLENKEKFAEGTNLKAWGTTIMKNIFINDYRKNERIGSQIITEQEGADVFGRLEVYSLEADDDSKLQDIRNAIDTLPELQRVCFNYYACGYLYHQIAEILDRPLGSVKSSIFEARKKLKKIITK